MQRSMRQRKPWPKAESPGSEGAIESVRCGKRVLRATRSRRQRGQDIISTKKQLTPRSTKKKQHISPTSSANSVVGDNNIVACQADLNAFNDLKDNTGLGWDDDRQTVTASDTVWFAYFQGHKAAEKFRHKGLDHYEFLQELCVGYLATGAFSSYPSSLSGPTLEEEREMLRQGKPIRTADRMSLDSRGKRKSDGTGGSDSKSVKIDEKNQAYANFGYAQQKRAEYLESKINMEAIVASDNAVECVTALNQIKSYVSDDQFYLDFDKLTFGPPVARTAFLALSEEQRITKGGKVTMASSESDVDDLADLEALEMFDYSHDKMPQRTAMMSGQEYVTFLLKEHPQTIRDIFRVDKHTFRALVRELITRGELNWEKKKLSVEESLAIFLYICGHSQRHRVVADKFQWSTATISKHFNLMRRALCRIAPHIIKLPNLHDTPPEILYDERYNPWFINCVGAIDGTHIEATVPIDIQRAFRSRKGTKTQNVMAVCSFDMKFTFVYPCWEGSAHDSRVFLAAATNPAYMFPHPPINKYYVVDSGYTNMVGYLTPYKGQRYHRDQWNGGNTVFATPQELFNFKHASLRNVIERCFGVLKARFPILKSMPCYSPARQPGIVTACCVVHNFIIIHRGKDEYFEGYMDVADWDGESDDDDDEDVADNEVHLVNTSAANVQQMGARRDEMAIAMWNAY